MDCSFLRAGSSGRRLPIRLSPGLRRLSWLVRGNNDELTPGRDALSGYRGRAPAERDYPQVAWPPTEVIVICPIVVLALAPCQWRSPALMCTTSPTLISRCSCSVATMPEPEVTTSIWS